MATSSQPNINDALAASKERDFRAKVTNQLDELIQTVAMLTKQVQELKEVRPAAPPVFQAEAPVKAPKTKE